MSRLAAICLLLVGCSRSNTVSTSPAAVEALQFLEERDSVISHEVEGNCVYVMFPKPPPKDWEDILQDAALAGNLATGHEFVAFGITGASDNWRAYADSNTIGVKTARSEEIVP